MSNDITQTAPVVAGVKRAGPVDTNTRLEKLLIQGSRLSSLKCGEQMLEPRVSRTMVAGGELSPALKEEGQTRSSSREAARRREEGEQRRSGVMEALMVHLEAQPGL